MGKQIIKMTESDLHQIIKESVNRILTELDWKTYANAARKADERAMDIARKPENAHLAVYQYNDDNKKNYEKNAGRSHAFTDAAKKSFDDKYGYKDDTTEVSSDRDVIPMLNGVAGYENGGKWHGKWDGIEGDYVGGYEPNIGARFWGKGKPDTYYNGGLKNPKAMDAYNKAKEEMGNYYKGNYDYQKGKGWQLKK